MVCNTKRWVILTLGVAFSLGACSGRKKRPVTVTGPQKQDPYASQPPGGQDAVGGGMGGGNGMPTPYPEATPTPDPFGGMATPTPVATPAIPIQSPGVLPDTTQNGTTNATISVTFGDGNAVNIDWDGKTHKGNDKWDIVPVQ